MEGLTFSGANDGASRRTESSRGQAGTVYSLLQMDDITIPSAVELRSTLGPRLGDAAVQARLDSERGEGRPRAGRSSLFSYFEHWFLGPKLLRGALKLSGLYRRGQANSLAIQLTNYDLDSARLPAALAGIRVLHLSDIHIDVSKSFQDALFAALSDVQSYDFCVITGDLRFQTYGDAAPTLAAMRQLRAHIRSRTFLVLGNHDSLRWVPVLEEAGYEVLVNEAAAVEHAGDRLWVVGVDDASYFGASDLGAAGSSVPDGACRLLLSHSPEIVSDHRMSDYDFVLCGHSHGGQINLPGGTPLVTNSRCPRRYCNGRWVKGRSQGYTSRGAGTSLLDVRFNCPPEISIHRLCQPARPAAGV